MKQPLLGNPYSKSETETIEIEALIWCKTFEEMPDSYKRPYHVTVEKHDYGYIGDDVLTVKLEDKLMFRAFTGTRMPERKYIIKRVGIGTDYISVKYVIVRPA